MQKVLHVIIGIKRQSKTIFGVALALLIVATTILFLDELPKVNRSPNLSQVNVTKYTLSMMIIGAVAMCVLGGIYLYRSCGVRILRIAILAIPSILFGIVVEIGIHTSAAMSSTFSVMRLLVKILELLILTGYAIGFGLVWVNVKNERYGILGVE